MSKEAENEKLTTLGIKVNQTVKERFEELKTDGAYDTSGQFLESLLERFSNPLKINKENEEKLHAANENIVKLRGELDAAQKQVSEKDNEISALNAKIAELRDQADKSVHDLNESYTSQQASMMKDHILVPISPLERKCLEYLTEREKKERKRTDITPEVFFMYTLSEMLIKGNKFSIKCVPDSVIEKFKKELKDE